MRLDADGKDAKFCIAAHKNKQKKCHNNALEKNATR